MKTEFNRNELAAIKRAAASIAPLITKRDKLIEKKSILNVQIEDIQNVINSFNAPIRDMTGYGADDLVVKDENNKLVFRHPDTIIPPRLNLEAMKEEAEALDETAVVNEVETTPADAPINLPY